MRHVDRIILLSGGQGSGKTTIATLLKQCLEQVGSKVHVFKFAAPLYEMHDLILPVLKRMGIRPESTYKDGPLLQKLGEYGREMIDVDIWAKVTRNLVDNFLRETREGFAIVDDCRFQNEFNIFPHALRVRLTCPEDIRKLRCGDTWRAKPHQSETDLDNYELAAKFDLVLDNFTNDKHTNAAHILNMMAGWCEPFKARNELGRAKA